MAGNSSTSGQGRRGSKGFRRASGLLQSSIRTAGEKRGFALSRLLTHWSEIVGAEAGEVSRPVSVKHARQGFGATLTILTSGANAPLLQMQEPKLRERINAAYGYAAITRIRFTQTAPTGFADAQTPFTARPKIQRRTDPGVEKAASKLAETVSDNELRLALSRLGTNVLSKKNS